MLLDAQEYPGFFPAFSLEEGEAVTINLGQSAFAHPPPEGFKAVVAARAGEVMAQQPRSDDAGGEGGDGGNGEDQPRSPIDLEQFSCATELAERFGPNRLKASRSKAWGFMFLVSVKRCGAKCTV